MKANKVNHSEILNNLKAEYETLTSARYSALIAWRESGNGCEDRDAHLLRTISRLDDEIKGIEKQIKFHAIMLQEKRYATMWLWSDAHAYEIIEEKSDKVILVRRLNATIKPEAQKALQDSFVPCGFLGHTNNNLQEWDFNVCESNPIETIRKHKDGRWYGCGKVRFTIEAEPYERYDYNF